MANRRGILCGLYQLLEVGWKIELTDDSALRERRIWLMISILLFALGISRLLETSRRPLRRSGVALLFLRDGMAAAESSSWLSLLAFH